MLGLESLEVVDQREIQKRGGKCAKFPVSCLIHSMLRSMGLEPGKLIVLDVTYGEGRFYGAWRPWLLLGSDIRVLKWVVEPDWFTRAPSWSVWRRVGKLGVSPDLVVIDPRPNTLQPCIHAPGMGTTQNNQVPIHEPTPKTKPQQPHILLHT